MNGYVPFVATLDDGTELLVTIQLDNAWTHLALLHHVFESVEVAFRTPEYRTWSAPTTCERAP